MRYNPPDAISNPRGWAAALHLAPWHSRCCLCAAGPFPRSRRDHHLGRAEKPPEILPISLTGPCMVWPWQNMPRRPSLSGTNRGELSLLPPGIKHHQASVNLLDGRPRLTWLWGPSERSNPGKLSSIHLGGAGGGEGRPRGQESARPRVLSLSVRVVLLFQMSVMIMAGGRESLAAAGTAVDSTTNAQVRRRVGKSRESRPTVRSAW